MTNDNERLIERRDTVEISRPAATVLTTVVGSGLLGLAIFILDVSTDLRSISSAIGENGRRIDHVEQWAERHDREARQWIYRIIGCENKVERCQEKYKRINGDGGS